MPSFMLRTSNRAAVSGGADAGRGGRTAAPMTLASSAAAASAVPSRIRPISCARPIAPAFGMAAIGV